MPESQIFLGAFALGGFINPCLGRSQQDMKIGEKIALQVC
jgi:hypothetical protein